MGRPFFAEELSRSPVASNVRHLAQTDFRAGLAGAHHGASGAFARRPNPVQREASDDALNAETGPTTLSNHHDPVFWQDPSVWTNGIPEPGQVAFVVGPTPDIMVVNTGDLSLFNITVNLSQAWMLGNSLSLANSKIIDTTDPQAIITAQSLLVLDKMSFIGFPEGGRPGENSIWMTSQS